MSSYLQNLWNKIMLKLGGVAALIPSIAAQIKVAIDAQDAAKARAHAQEFKEFCEKGIALAEAVIDATADGTIDLVEGSQLALDLESLADEGDDIVKGADD